MKPFISSFIFYFLLPSSPFAQKLNYPDFTIEKLTDGVYAAIQKNGGHAISNAGIIDLGDATLIFDTFMSVQAAEDLKKAAQELTGHPVKYVVNSHFHNDHVGGNQVFDGATIISTYRTRDLMAEYQPEEIEFGKTKAPAKLQAYIQQDVSKMTDHELEEYIMWKGYFETYVISADVLKLTLPNLTMDDELNLYGSKRHVQLISYGEGHTESDLFLYLPEEQIAFMGDLLFIKNQPWIDDGDTQKWEDYLTKVTSLGVKTLVPGHGPVGTTTDIDIMEAYFQNVKDTAHMYHDKGISPEEVKGIPSPPPYDSWFLSRFYQPNVISAYNRLYKK